MENPIAQQQGWARHWRAAPAEMREGAVVNNRSFDQTMQEAASRTRVATTIPNPSFDPGGLAYADARMGGGGSGEAYATATLDTRRARAATTTPNPTFDRGGAAYADARINGAQSGEAYAAATLRRGAEAPQPSPRGRRATVFEQPDPAQPMANDAAQTYVQPAGASAEMREGAGVYHIPFDPTGARAHEEQSLAYMMPDQRVIDAGAPTAVSAYEGPVPLAPKQAAYTDLGAAELDVAPPLNDPHAYVEPALAVGAYADLGAAELDSAPPLNDPHAYEQPVLLATGTQGTRI